MTRSAPEAEGKVRTHLYLSYEFAASGRIAAESGRGRAFFKSAAHAHTREHTHTHTGGSGLKREKAKSKKTSRFPMQC